jgi:F-type H+-transporting ATPase subunit a
MQPDVLFKIPTPFGPFPVTSELWVTWGVMAAVLLVAALISYKIRRKERSRLVDIAEVLIGWLEKEIRTIVGREPGPFIGLVAAMFVFILTANLVSFIGIKPPTAYITTTGALAMIVFLSVPYFGVKLTGVGNYIKTYLEPSPLLLPLNIISELSRTLALAVRLFGNIFSGEVLVGVLLSLVPFVLPLPLMFLGLLTGTIQAYIFAILTMVYIGGAVRAVEQHQLKEE